MAVATATAAAERASPFAPLAAGMFDDGVFDDGVFDDGVFDDGVFDDGVAGVGDFDGVAGDGEAGDAGESFSTTKSAVASCLWSGLRRATRISPSGCALATSRTNSLISLSGRLARTH